MSGRTTPKTPKHASANIRARLPHLCMTAIGPGRFCMKADGHKGDCGPIRPLSEQEAANVPASTHRAIVRPVGGQIQSTQPPVPAPDEIVHPGDEPVEHPDGITLPEE